MSGERSKAEIARISTGMPSSITVILSKPIRCALPAASTTVPQERIGSGFLFQHRSNSPILSPPPFSHRS